MELKLKGGSCGEVHGPRPGPARALAGTSSVGVTLADGIRDVHFARTSLPNPSPRRGMKTLLPALRILNPRRWITVSGHRVRRSAYASRGAHGRVGEERLHRM